MDMKSLIPWNRNQVSTSRADENPFLGLHRQMNRLFDDFFTDVGLPAPRNGWSLASPSVEVTEDEKQIRVVAELPGLEEKDIDLALRDGILTMRGEKKSESKTATYSERWYGQFSRSIDVGTEVDSEKVNASFKNGVLTVTLDKLPTAQSRTKRIAINQ